MDCQRLEERIFTFARICVDVDLNKGLSDHIQLIHKQMNWTQNIDYENTTFRCRIYKQTGHLQNLCPEAKKKTMYEGRKMGNNKKDGTSSHLNRKWRKMRLRWTSPFLGTTRLHKHQKNRSRPLKYPRKLGTIRH